MDEPIHSFGDWLRRRRALNLTRHELEGRELKTEQAITEALEC